MKQRFIAWFRDSCEALGLTELILDILIGRPIEEH